MNVYIYIYVYICVYWRISVFTCTLCACLVAVAVVGTEPGCASMSGVSVDMIDKNKETTRQQSHFDFCPCPCDLCLYSHYNSKVDLEYKNDPLWHCCCSLCIPFWCASVVYALAAYQVANKIKEEGLDIKLLGIYSFDRLRVGKGANSSCIGCWTCTCVLCDFWPWFWCNKALLRNQILSHASAFETTAWKQTWCLVSCCCCDERFKQLDFYSSCFVVCCCADVNFLQLWNVNRGAKDEPAVASVAERARLVSPPGVITLEL